MAQILSFPPGSGSSVAIARRGPGLLERAERLVERLRNSHRSGRTRPLSWRRVQLGALQRFLEHEEEAILQALEQDLGKPRYEAVTGEIGVVKAELREALGQLERWSRPEAVRVPLVHQPGRARVERVPLGVVLIIGPWNYPLQLILAPLVSAIAAGNAAVLKPSEHAPATAALLARALPRYLDPESVAVFDGAVEAAQALLAQRFDHIFFTGGGRVGREVMKAAAEHLSPVTLELGGKSPAIVDASADIEIAARRIAWGRFYNAGQTCVAPDYVLVERSVAMELRAALERSLDAFYGPHPAASPDYARIVNLAHLRRLQGLLQGVEVVRGGGADEEALFMEPTLVWDPPQDSALMQEEIFGPILPVVPVDDLEQALAMVQRRPDPLSVYHFSRDRRAQERVRVATRSGGLVFNDVIVHLTVPSLPFGGVGASGLGRAHGRAGFETFSQQRSVMSHATWFDPPVRYPPYTDGKLALSRKLL
jgi:aldehyde dehydrogenase (NAD+)